MTLNLNNLPQYMKDQLPYDQTVPQTQPQTNNYLANNRFQFFLKRCPNLTYFCQRANIPSISFGTSLQSTPTIGPLKRPGTSYLLEDISLGFLIDENMKNWLEIFNWMKSIGIYNTSTEPLKEKDKTSDAFMIITNSAYIPIVGINFYNVFPTQLSGIDFDSSLTDTDPIIANVILSYTHYEISTI